jgi:hypothetical protein
LDGFTLGPNEFYFVERIIFNLTNNSSSGAGQYTNGSEFYVQWESAIPASSW